jgi:hypothetical protein
MVFAWKPAASAAGAAKKSAASSGSVLFISLFLGDDGGDVRTVCGAGRVTEAVLAGPVMKRAD